MKPSAILSSAAAMLLAVAASAPADILVNDTFESDILNPSPRVGLGTDPAGWANDLGDSINANGLTDISVEGVGGPQGGSQTMLFFDSNGVDGRIADSRTFTPVSTSAVTVTLDFRVNSVIDPAADKFAIRLFSTGNQSIGVELAGNGSSTGFNIRPLGHTNTTVLGEVTVGDWYQMTLEAPSVDSGSTEWQLTLHNYATASTDTFALTLPAPASGEYWRILLQSGFADANTLDMSFDNVTVEAITVIPEPSTALLLFGGGLLMWQRCQRSKAARR
ncbi:MAG TPA: PEP-CTERM sorting domain-containing protein [Kiritimatiellia bacterium]|nr:PEP-CTERM sorting domain-containing protein [Kiritimatiellia bacterium]